MFNGWLHEARVYGEWLSMSMKLGCLFCGWLYKAGMYVHRLGVLKSQSVCGVAAYMKLDCVFNSWVYEARLCV